MTDAKAIPEGAPAVRGPDSDRESILAELPSPTGGEAPAVFDRKPPLATPRPTDLDGLWLTFDEAFAGLGGQVVPAEALSLLLAREGGVWVDDDALAFVPRGVVRAPSVWEAEIGVCLADAAVAETGSLLVSAGVGRARLTSLAPPVNVILIREDAIVAMPEDVFSHLPAATSVLIGGTSRTGDIEGILIRGVHGPRELYLVRI